VRPHWLAIVEGEIGSESNDAGPVSLFELEPCSHLRIDLQLIVHAEEGVIDEIAVVARDRGSGPDRIEAAEVGIWYHTKGACFERLSDSYPRQSRRVDCSLYSSQEDASPHAASSLLHDTVSPIVGTSR
jgi:hypothetical protein